MLLMRIIKVVTNILFVLVIVVCAEYADSSSEFQYLNALPCIDTTLSRNPGVCWEINSSKNEIIEHYYRKGEIDSASQFISFISKHCGDEYGNSKFKILHQIVTGTFNEDSIPSTFFLDYARIAHYMWRWEKDETYIREFSKTLSHTMDTSTVSFLFTLFCAGNQAEFYRRLRFDSSFSHTRLKSLYDCELNFAQRTYAYQIFGFSTIAAAPGNSSRGIFQPDIGVLGRIRVRNLFGDLYGSFGIDPRKSRSEVMSGNTYHAAIPNVHLNLGFDIGYSISFKYEYDLDLIVGTMCNAEWLRSTAENDSTIWMRTSIYPSPGIGYRFYLFRRRILISPQIRYWFVNHDRLRYNGKNIRYHAIGFRIIVGPSDRYAEHKMLESLGAIPMREMD
jgi:hypothetical protein